MTDPFTEQGLDNRTRVMEKPEGAEDYFGDIVVDSITIGGVVIEAVQGTRYANGRLRIRGRKDNSIEIELKPGQDCQTKGVISQILWYAQESISSFKRFAISIVKDGSDVYGTDDQRVVVDSTRSINANAMPVYMPVMGGASNPDGTDVPKKDKLSFSYFQDGSHEISLHDDSLRVEIASFIDAFITGDRSKMRAREKDADGNWKWVVFEK